MSFRHLILISLFIWPAHTLAHEFPDQHVERTLAVQVRDQTVRLEYSIGMNDQTLQDCVKLWQEEKKSKSDRDLSQTENPTDLDHVFRKLALAQLSSQIQIEWNGESLSDRIKVSELTPRRHMNLTIQLELQIPGTEAGDLTIVDRNFRDQPGSIRLAMKAKGNAVLLNSTAAPILVRAERSDLSKMNVERRLQACTIKARIVQAK